MSTVFDHDGTAIMLVYTSAPIPLFWPDPLISDPDDAADTVAVDVELIADPRGVDTSAAVHIGNGPAFTADGARRLAAVLLRAADVAARDPLTLVRDRIAELSGAVDGALDETVARPLAEELHALLDVAATLAARGGEPGEEAQT